MTETELDYDERYDLPIHWILDPAGRIGVDYFDYVERAIGLVGSEPARVLDAGCGDGYLASELVRRGHQVTGVDASPSAIGFARTLVGGATFLVGDLRDLSSALDGGEPFDVALLVEVIEHIPVEDQGSVLQGLHSLLKAGGRLVITVPTTNRPLIEWHYRHYTVADLTSLLGEHGFEVERVGFQFRLTPLSRALFADSKLWRVFENRLWDFKLVRGLLARMFRRRYAEAPDEASAGRLVVSSRAD
jgi:2-polyprenyl-3-methyl-5-hydroxy-6-metoxy-1,4-benzoquinol methylase